MSTIARRFTFARLLFPNLGGRRASQSFLPFPRILPRILIRLGCGLVACALLVGAQVVAAQAVFLSQPVGSSSSAQAVSVMATAAGTVSKVQVLAMGVSGLDFAPGTGSSTCSGAALAKGQSCTEQVTFSPVVPGQRLGAVVLWDANNNLLGTTYVSGTGSGALATLSSGALTTVAGVYATYEGVGDGYPATQGGELYLPTGIAMDGAGNLYIADSLHNRLRMVCGKNPPPFVTNCGGVGYITTVAGNGNPSYTGDGHLAANSTLRSPNGVAVDGAGNIYIADTGNNTLRMINGTTGVITTFASNGAGNSGYGGDGSAATAASVLFDQPTGVSLDVAGNLYIADTSNHRIREVSVATGLVTTVAGTGFKSGNGDGGYNTDGITAILAELNYPRAVAFDTQGNMYIPDSGNQRVREVTAVGGAISPASLISTFAGTGLPGATNCSATPTSAATTPLNTPSGVAVDAAGDVLIADTQNYAIREVNAATGLISNLALKGCGSPFLNGNSNPLNTGPAVVVYGPIGLALDGYGNILFADSLDMVVAEIQGSYQSIDYTASPVRQGSQSAAVLQSIENHGNAPLDLAVPTAGTNTALGPTGTCAAGTPYLAPAGTCTVAAIFAPTAAGDPLAGDITIAANTQPGPPSVTAPNSPLDIHLVGNATAVNSTTTVVTSMLNPSSFGQSVTFNVTVTTGSGTGNLTGTVGLADTYNGTTTTLASLLPVSLNTAGTTATATFPISTLGVGVHTIVASYSGDSGHFSSTSTDFKVAPLKQLVQEGTTTTLISSANPSLLGASVTFTAQVAIGAAGGGVTPTGSITFSWGSNVQSVALDANGKATYTTSVLPNGVTAVTAVYGGDTTTQVLTSQATLNQDVQVASSAGVTSNGTPSIYGSPVVFTATVTSASTSTPTGKVTFLDSGTTIGTGTLSGTPATATFSDSVLSVASHPITVSYAGDNYNASSSSTPAYIQVVNQTPTTTVVSANPTPGIAGGTESIVAKVQTSSGTGTLTGQVTFSTGSTPLGTVAVGSGGTATIPVTPALGPGAYPIIAIYSGDANDQGSTSFAFTLVVNQATTQTAVVVTPSAGVVAQSISFTAKVTGNGGTPGGTVSFLSGTTVLGLGTLSSGTATFSTAALAAGTYSITAVYGGDTNDAGSISPVSSFTIGTIPTTTSLGVATTGGNNAQVVLVATVVDNIAGPVPTGTVTFASGGTTLGTAAVNSAGVATLTPSLINGTNYSIVASYAGDPSHGASQSSIVVVSGTAVGFSITITPNTLSLATTQNTAVAVEFASVGGFADTLTLGCAGLPTAMNCHFASPTVALPANGIADVQLTIDTNNPLSGGTVAMNRTGGAGKVALAGLLLPGGLALGWLLWRQRRRSAWLVTGMLAILLSAAALAATGCGNSITQASVAPGTYTIEVTGTGQNSNIIHYQTVTITVK